MAKYLIDRIPTQGGTKYWYYIKKYIDESTTEICRSVRQKAIRFRSLEKALSYAYKQPDCGLEVNYKDLKLKGQFVKMW